MKGYELTELLNETFADRGTAGGLVMVRDVGTGRLFSVKNVVSETHHDADGSTTHWIEVEEY